MSRIGKIAVINLHTRMGEIIDEHDQEISFTITKQLETLQVNDQIFFEIEMSPTGLQATNIQRLKT